MDFTVKHDDSKSRFYAEVSGDTAELNYKKKMEIPWSITALMFPKH